MIILFFFISFAALICSAVFLVKLFLKKSVEEKNKVKKRLFISLAGWIISFILMIVSASIDGDSSDQLEQKSEPSASESISEVSSDEIAIQNELKNNSEELKSEDNSEVLETDDELKTLRENLKKQYDVSEPSEFVRGDATGKWRIVKVANGTAPSEYAVDYAKAYMTDGDVHYIVNFSLNTTTQFRLLAGVLSVVTTEYVDKEEHDAKIIGQGLKYTERYFDMTSGAEITTDADEDVGIVDDSALINAVSEAFDGQVGAGESITDVSFTNGELKITVDLSKADTSIFTAADLAESRTSSITDAILELDDQYYNTWSTVTVDFGAIGNVTFDKNDVKDEGYGKFFEFQPGIFEQ